MELEGIFENCIDGTLYWIDGLDDGEMSRALYLCDPNEAVGFHACRKSACYEDLTSYIDELQKEEAMDARELYVVTYDEFTPGYGLSGSVDFAISKDEIIAAVRQQRYVEGATYYTLGQVMKTTRDYLRGGAQAVLG